MQDLLALAQAGPVAILLVGIVVLTRAFLTGSVVPGWVYKAEQEQRMKSETAAIRNSESIAVMTKLLQDNAEALTALTKAVTDVPGASDAK